MPRGNSWLVVMALVPLGFILGLYGMKNYTTSRQFGSETDCRTSIENIVDVTTLFTLGENYFSNPDRYDLYCARFAYTAAVRAGSDNSQLYYQLGRINFLEGRFTDAIDNFSTQIEKYGEGTQAVYYMLGLSYAYRARDNNGADDWGAAESAFRHFLELEPKSPWARTDLSWVYFAQGKYQEMFPVLEVGLAVNNMNPWLHNMYGLALLNIGQKDLAREHFKIASELVKDYTPQTWAAAYPGNNPHDWSQGVMEFKNSIAANLELTE